MKFLFLHDIYTSRFKLILLASLGALSTMVIYSSNDSFILYSTQYWGLMIAVTFVNSLYSENKKVKWKEYQWALPIKKSTMVNEKFLFVLAIAIILISVNFLVLMLTKDGWYVEEDGSIAFIATQFVIFLFLYTSAMFIGIMVESISGDKGAITGITIAGTAVLLGLNSVSLYIIPTFFNSNFLDDIWALTIWGSTMLAVTIGITYTISLLYVKKGREIL